MTIGQRIQKARKKNNLTQKELAAKLGLATGSIQQYELDKREPSIDRLFELSEHLNVDIRYLLGVVDADGCLTPEAFADPEDFEFINALGINIPDSRGNSSDDPNATDLGKARINAAYDQLNATGQEEAVKRVEELTEIPKYKK